MLKRIELTTQISFSLLKSMGSSNDTIHECSIGWFHCISLCCVILCISSWKGSTSALSQRIWPMKTAASICPNHQQCSQSMISLIYGNHSIHLASILLLVHWCLGFMGPLGLGFWRWFWNVSRGKLCVRKTTFSCVFGETIFHTYIWFVARTKSVQVPACNRICSQKLLLMPPFH